MRYSIIIPVYNAEKTILRCLTSIMVALKNYSADAEIIIIDDGSTDNSLKICNQFRAKNVMILHHSNMGVSSTRNVGIKYATGDYILFVDSDDYVSEDMFNLLERETRDFFYDFVLFSHIVKTGISERLHDNVEYTSMNQDDIAVKISELICNKKINGPVAKLYKRKILNENRIMFPAECNIAEDRAFNITYSLYVNSIKVCNQSYYYACRDNTDSLSRRIRSEEELQRNFNIGEKVISAALYSCMLSEKNKRKIIAALDFSSCMEVYSRAKRMNLRGSGRKTILTGIKKDCERIIQKEIVCPKTKYCMLIWFPVKFKLYHIIYMVAMRLAKRK